MEIAGLSIAALIVALFVVARAVRIVPQVRARNVERLGRYYRTPQPGLNIVIPFTLIIHWVDRLSSGASRDDLHLSF
jgi:regulator of protease activity HflC (stomatin/prohibitin superfamily)